jgi:hypothetical protein
MVSKISVEHDFIQKLLDLLPKTLMSWKSLALAHYVAHKVPGKPILGQACVIPTLMGRGLTIPQYMSMNCFKLVESIAQADINVMESSRPCPITFWVCCQACPNWLVWHLTQHKDQGL